VLFYFFLRAVANVEVVVPQVSVIIFVHIVWNAFSKVFPLSLC